MIAVIGASQPDPSTVPLAEEAGRMVARLGAILVCGGLDGLMKAACRGAKSAGGMTIGLLPGKDKADANEFVDLPICTTIGYARNACVAASGDIVVALPGSHGTLCEISYAFVYKRPVIDLGGWNREGMIPAKDVNDAEEKIREMIQSSGKAVE